MPRLTRKLPSYRLHKPSGLAVVTLDGRDHYLGEHGSQESRAAYDRIIAEWLANGRRSRRAADTGSDMPAASSELTVDQVVRAFWSHAEQHYQTPTSEPTGELANFKDSLRSLRRLYGVTPARDFSPLRLKAVRQAMIDAGLCRSTINQRVGRIVHVFKWAVSEELVPAAVHQGLITVSGLQRGRSKAKESEPIKPVSDAQVDAIRPHVLRQVWAMIELQRLTGMRPGEVVIMRTCDIDRSGPVWTYKPSAHKTLHRGLDRTIYLGPQAQGMLLPWLRADREAFLFSPAEARAERLAEMRGARKTRVQPSQRNRRKPGARRRPGTRFSPKSYYHAIRAACDRLHPHPTLSKLRKKDLTKAQRAELNRWSHEHAWHPNQLRHSAATRLRREFGLDVARVILGHTSPVVTEVYAELDRDRAVAVMAEVG